jgi:hypothetical protein
VASPGKDQSGLSAVLALPEVHRVLERQLVLEVDRELGVPVRWEFLTDKKLEIIYKA